MKTRDKIISKAKKVFNKAGFSAISLFELASIVGISRGNLTYHFKDKDILLEAIANEMWQKIETERNKSRQFPSFENLHNEVQLYYKFQREYAFIFLDVHVLNHPIIKAQFRKMAKQTIADNEATIAFSIKVGNMKQESFAGLYYNLAFISWLIAFFWLTQQKIRGSETNEDGEKMIWSILLPHFTNKGIESFKSFFGEDYYNTIGQPFKVDIDKLIPF
ncbi:MAG: TetR/AcrR family transcriptional regulator [Chitinophagales bacterium]